MKDFYEFAGAHPFLTFFIAYFVFCTITESVRHIFHRHKTPKTANEASNDK